MKTIIFMSIKGGCGKTVLADELMFGLDRDDIQYSFFDLSDNAGHIHKPNEKPAATLQIVDDKSDLHSEMKKYVLGSDLIIVPTMAGSYEKAPLETMLKIIKVHKRENNTLIVINQWRDNDTNRKYLAWLDKNYPEFRITKVVRSTDITAAAWEDMSVDEYAPESKGAESITDLYKYIKLFLNLKEGNRHSECNEDFFRKFSPYTA